MSVSCSCDIQVEVSRALLPGGGYCGGQLAVYSVAPQAVVAAVSVSLCEVASGPPSGVSFETPLRFASLSRMLHGSVLVTDAVVSLGGTGGEPQYRVTRCVRWESSQGR